MNRMHPGIPPSGRRNWSGDWRERLRTTTQSLATKMRGAFEFDDPFTRRLLIEGVRLALSDATDRTLNLDDEEDGSVGAEQAAVAVTAKAYRIILGGDGVDRKDPMLAESFMLVVERALDDMGLGWRSKVRYAAGVTLALVRQMDKLEGVEARDKVFGYAREAMGASDDEEFFKLAEMPQGMGLDPKEWVASPPGIFRVALNAYGLDYRSPRVQADVMAEVAAAIDAELPG